MIDGDGDLTYAPERIIADYSEREASLPPDLAAMREGVASAPGGLWNSPLYGLEALDIQRTPVREDPILLLHFKNTDYFTYLSTNRALDDILTGSAPPVTVRERYMAKPDWTVPPPEFANALGIVLVLLAQDQVMVCVRSRFTGQWAGCYTSSIGEFMSIEKDRSPKSGHPDVYQCAVRGVREEVGLECDPRDIVFLSFGVGVDFCEWSLIGMVRTVKSPSEISAMRTRGLNSAFENDQIHWVEWQPDAVFSFVACHDPWAPGALACLYHALVKTFGRDAVDRSAKQLIR